METIENLCKLADDVREKAQEHEKKYLIDCVNSLVKFHHEVYGKKDIDATLKIRLPVPKLPLIRK